MEIMANLASAWIVASGVVALLIVGVGLYWLVNRQARLRDIAALRKKLDDLLPTDPEYGAVRALYTSMVIDAHRWGSHSDAGSNHEGGGASHGAGGHATDHSGGDSH